MNAPDPLEVATLNMVLWRGEPLKQAQAFLLTLALQRNTVNGSMLPGELTGGSRAMSGIVVRILLQTGLLECIGYEKSKRESAHSRRVATLRIPAGGRAKVQSWLERAGYSDPCPSGQTLLAV